MRLSKGSPERETTINYIIKSNDGSGVIKKKSMSSYQGAREAFYTQTNKMRESRNYRASGNSVVLATSNLLERNRNNSQVTANNFMKKRRTT